MALCWQLFYAGPVVRFIFKNIFKEKNIQKDKPIVVLMEKGWEQVVAVVSILNAGYT